MHEQKLGTLVLYETVNSSVTLSLPRTKPSFYVGLITLSEYLLDEIMPAKFMCAVESLA